MSARAASTLMAISASLNPTPWNCQMGLPNMTRSREYFVAYSSAPAAIPSACAPTPGRDVSNVFLDGVLSSTWEWTYNQLASVDVGKRRITLAGPELQGIGLGESVRLPHFHFENIPEEIDTPGEHYVDRAKGLLYVVDTLGHDVLVFALSSGQLVRRFGSPGTRPGQFNYPTHIFVDGAGAAA